MVYISRLKLKNFKSFKVADIPLPKTYICIAGGNGCGKSNLCDAIRFVLGETSLRNLRARKVKDLIHNDSKSAEVILTFLDDQNLLHEVKRAISEDGKVIYRLNGERVTRTSIVETLKKFGFDDSGRNTVAQGEVARIINMNGKERRGIIDSVAGISDFEQKKKEAMSELEVVDTRIKDSNLVLGERRAFVEELGREKEVALKFVETKKTLSSAKATLLKFEITKCEKDLKEATVKDDEINKFREQKNSEISKIEEEIRKVESKRDEVSKELQSKRDTHALIRKIEELKASIGAKEQQLKDKKEGVEKTKAEIVKIGWEITGEKNVIEDIKKEIENLKIDLKLSESKLKEMGGELEDKKVKKARELLEAAEEEYSKIKVKVVQFEAQLRSKSELLEAKKSEIGSIGGMNAEEGENKESTNNVQIIERQISDLFRKTKEINAQISQIDKEMLEMREKLAMFKVRSNPQLANPAIALVKEIRNKGERGIYGIVSDLIESEPQYTQAIEAAAGARLMYVVVDSVDTATRTIEKLKAAKVGRASFIPIDSIKVPPLANSKGFQSILNVINTKSEFSRAIEYVFSDTLLINRVEDAKTVGIGNARMVTMEGEIFERSGIVSGGRNESGILGSNQLRKLEDEAAALKNSKESLISELYSIREEESKLRAEKAQIEIKIKTQEMKSSLLGQNSQRREKIQREIAELEKVISDGDKILEKERSDLQVHLERCEKLKKELLEIEDSNKKENQESSNQRAELSAKVSSIKATIDGRNKEIEIRSKEIEAKSTKNLELEELVKAESRAIISVKTQFENEKIELSRSEEEMGEKSVEIEALFNKLKEFDQEFAKWGKEAGAKRIEMEKMGKEMNQVEIKRATATQRLADLMVEFENYKDAPILEEPIEEIKKKVAEKEAQMNSLGPVNMAAIEMYDKKLSEISEIVEKIKTLETEREAIILMINEIDEKKKEAFFETFKAVSEHFQKMFKYVDIGEGHLFLDKPNEPFESGMFIKIRRNNKEYNLDAFSGGEKTIVAMMFIFALQFFKPSPFYILDEVDAALDKQNSKRLSELVAQMAKDSQFIVVSHNDTVMSGSETVIGVTKAAGVSKAVGVKLKASEKAIAN
jgi:chromosome segregation protein